MFDFFKRKSKAEILKERYDDLMWQSHKMSLKNKLQSDKLFVAAQEVLIEIEMLDDQASIDCRSA